MHTIVEFYNNYLKVTYKIIWSIIV